MPSVLPSLECPKFLFGRSLGSAISRYDFARIRSALASMLLMVGFFLSASIGDQPRPV